MLHYLESGFTRTRCLGCLMALVLLCPAQLRAQKHPWPEGEKLTLEIFWPSGVTLGEATLDARSIKDIHYFSASVEVVLPQGHIIYKLYSTATAELCSREFRQSVQRSGKVWEETTSFDAESGKAMVTRDARSREYPAAKCLRDPLTYLYFFRSQAAAGKRATAESLFLNGLLSLRIDALASEMVKIKRSERRGERYQIRFPGSAGEGRAELWLDGASAQTPIAVRLPLPFSTFSAELR